MERAVIKDAAMRTAMAIRISMLVLASHWEPQPCPLFDNEGQANVKIVVKFNTGDVQIFPPD